MDFFGEIRGMRKCSGHAFRVHWIDLEHRRRAGGMLLGCLGVLVGMPWDHGGSLGASWDGAGRPLGCFWRYGAILGSVLRGQNVAISLVLEGFLRCHVFLMIFHRYLDAMLFS